LVTALRKLRPTSSIERQQRNHNTPHPQVVSHGTTPIIAFCHYQLRRLQAAAIRGGRKGNPLAAAFQTPISFVSRKMRNQLSSTAMAALEVALELWLALTASPQARWTTYSTTATSAVLNVRGPDFVFSRGVGWLGRNATLVLNLL
jgi:hypothetical protein